MKRDARPRYSAKLLFQFRVVTRGVSNKRRTCEERLIVFRSGSAEEALRYAKLYGKRESHRYKNSSGGAVHFEFVGVLDLLCPGVECEKEEVWYDIIELLKPMERRKALLPPESKLNAIAWARAATQPVAAADGARLRRARRR